LLKEKISDYMGGLSPEVSVVYLDFETDYRIDINSETIFRSASLIKVPIMIEVLNQVKQGKLRLADMIQIDNRDKVNYSILTDLDTNSYMLKDIITLMIVLSDNSATNILMDIVGIDNINQTIKSLNLDDTILQRKMMDFEAAKKGFENKTSPRNMGLIFEKLYKKEILSEDMSSLMLDILIRQKDYSNLKRYLSEDTKVAHKSGGLKGLSHDVGIFYTENGNYLLGIFVENAIDNAESMDIIGKISKLVYDYRKDK